MSTENALKYTEGISNAVDSLRGRMYFNSFIINMAYSVGWSQTPTTSGEQKRGLNCLKKQHAKVDQPYIWIKICIYLFFMFNVFVA